MYRAAARLVREGPRENLLRLVREVVEDAAADGAVWIEPHVNPLTYETDPDAALDLLDVVIDEVAVPLHGSGSASASWCSPGVTRTLLRASRPPASRPAGQDMGWSPSAWPGTRPDFPLSRSPRHSPSPGMPG